MTRNSSSHAATPELGSHAEAVGVAEHGLALLEAYPERRVRMVVFCGPGTGQVPLALQGGSLPYRLEGVAVGTQDGAATLARLRTVAAEAGAWADTLTALFDRALSATAIADL